MPITKVNITTKLVHKLIAAQYPQWADLEIKPVASSGWDNRTFHLGEDKSVRLPSAQEYSSQVEKEQYWLPKLAPKLPLQIPIPLAMGKPSEDFPFNWSVYQWLEGQTASLDQITDRSQFATSLAEFLVALQKIDASTGPKAGAHNFFRGGPLSTYDTESRQAIATLSDKKFALLATQIWNAALASSWQKKPVWVHGDVAMSNLLIQNGQLSAVLDFGCLGVGDPACDLAPAWTMFKDESRVAFRDTLQPDKNTWARGRGWVLWKTLCAPIPGTNCTEIFKQLTVDFVGQ